MIALFPFCTDRFSNRLLPHGLDSGGLTAAFARMNGRRSIRRLQLEKHDRNIKVSGDVNA